MYPMFFPQLGGRQGQRWVEGVQPRGPLWGLCSLEQGQFNSGLNYKAGSSVNSPSLQMRQLRCKEGGVTWLHISRVVCGWRQALCV